MPRYQIADFIIDFQNRFPYLEKMCAKYLYEGDAETDYVISVTDEDLQEEQRMAEHPCTDGYLETICAYRKLCNVIPRRRAFVLHSSVIEWQGQGIAFFARSGVGKTTHTRNWLKAFYPHVKIVNGDKPLVRFYGEQPFVYGTPWAGKEGANRNVKVPLTDLCLIQRGEKNEVSPLSKQEALELLMVQILLPKDPLGLSNTLDMLEGLLDRCRLWRIRCTPEEESAIIARQTMFGE